MGGTATANDQSQATYQNALAALKGDIANAAAIATWDPAVRAQYQQRIATYVAELQARVRSGELSWAQAAEEANTTRNATMELLRSRSSPVGRAMAEYLKRDGKTLNELIARYTQKIFGQAAEFPKLNPAQQEQIFAEVVSAAGRSNPRVNLWMRGASRAGKGLIVLSLAISVYNVATSDNPMATAKKEVVVTGAGVLGGAAGGALAGLACGPGAPVCVTVGAFVGGALAAFGVDLFWGK